MAEYPITYRDEPATFLRANETYATFDHAKARGGKPDSMKIASDKVASYITSRIKHNDKVLITYLVDAYGSKTLSFIRRADDPEGGSCGAPAQAAAPEASASATPSGSEMGKEVAGEAVTVGNSLTKDPVCNYDHSPRTTKIGVLINLGNTECLTVEVSGPSDDITALNRDLTRVLNQYGKDEITRGMITGYQKRVIGEVPS